jgi:hypothetical protein
LEIAGMVNCWREKRKSTAPARAVPNSVLRRCTFVAFSRQTSYRPAANKPFFAQSYPLLFALLGLEQGKSSAALEVKFANLAGPHTVF